MKKQLDNCFITYIVATYNCINEVYVLINTVSSLSDLPVEFVVSDGGSFDGTLEILKDVPNLIIACSSPDKGIYDAWNRAIPFAKGKYIGFIGVDDIPQRDFIQEANIASDSSPSISLLYGNVRMESNDLYRNIIAPEIPDLFNTARPCLDIPHQGMLHSRSLFIGNEFNSDFKIAGDLHFLLKVHQKGLISSYRKLRNIQAIVNEDGISRSSQAWRILLPEYKFIEQDLCLRLGYSHFKTKILSFFFYMPRFFLLIKKISWQVKGTKKKCNEKAR